MNVSRLKEILSKYDGDKEVTVYHSKFLIEKSQKPIKQNGEDGISIEWDEIDLTGE